MQTELYDVIIVGGGPAGSSAALYTSRAALRTLVIDKDPHAGALGMAHSIANYPGVPDALTGMQLLELMKRQAVSFGALYLRDKVTGIDPEGPEKTVFTVSGKFYRAKSLILATGAMGKSSEIPGEKKLVGLGVSYCATCDAAFYKGRVVAVYGKNREAVEEALVLCRFASKVMLLCPGGKLAVREDEAELLNKAENVEIRYHSKVLSVNGERGVESLTLEGVADPLPVEGFFIYLSGSSPVLDFIGGLLEISGCGCLKVDREFATSAPGVFAAGDMLCKEIKQAVIVAAEGCHAALYAGRFLRGTLKPKSDYN
ncbi:MAG: FAD-dependent oxidoreductase [Chlorobium sp.]|uniref:NAD(P)/FAD-dependent oxidoreductase n=1 Tax=Chlorobium sp. TaxID=1095 RepID=UPI0025C64795|nr:FAD-dependent oxidoreductase [Chlorobium sp.]MCF8382771.1 FAD-dependent oxidoreductase [Chlorobium sp.]